MTHLWKYTLTISNLPIRRWSIRQVAPSTTNIYLRISECQIIGTQTKPKRKILRRPQNVNGGRKREESVDTKKTTVMWMKSFSILGKIGLEALEVRTFSETQIQVLPTQTTSKRYLTEVSFIAWLSWHLKSRSRREAARKLSKFKEKSCVRFARGREKRRARKVWRATHAMAKESRKMLYFTDRWGVIRAKDTDWWFNSLVEVVLEGVYKQLPRKLKSKLIDLPEMEKLLEFQVKATKRYLKSKALTEILSCES